MTLSRTLLKPARLIHLYLGVFISPALLFFAITGALQTFSLHETTRGSNYKPPAWIAKLGQLHKKQTLVIPERRPQPPAPSSNKPGDAAAAPRAGATLTVTNGPVAKPKNLLPMKIFFLLVSVGLVISTVTGIFMAYRYSRNAVAISILLVAGVALPLLLLLF